MLGYIAKKIFGSVNDRAVRKLYERVAQINLLEPQMVVLSDGELKAKTTEFKARLKQGETLDDLLPESFAVVREAAKRVLNMRHFDVQLIGGIALHQGKIAEMKTGEGKTLVATLPCYLNALSEKGVHVVTVNDYLAKRDADWMGKVHVFLGLSVGCLTGDLDDEERKAAYDCDITYATNNELGFDYLRDNMKYSLASLVQREKNFAIVDEVDSILIDEARTPLIISGPTNDNSKLYQEIDQVIPKLTAKDYLLEEKERGVFLTEEGVEEVERILKASGSIEQDSSLYDPKYISLVHHVNCALRAHKIFKNEIDYIVKDGSVVIVDEFTGRMQEGRRFSDGMHQALEAKEQVRVRNENQTLASITFQNYFRLYNKLAGMTGTAVTEAVEFEEIYNLKVVEIPTNQIVTRRDEDDEIYKTEKAKYDAVLKQVKECHARKQPMLIGTVSIEKSEKLSRLLKEHKLPHKVLNAKYHAQEAEIIAQAGRPGGITIATNMAGRGTDIMLGGNPEILIEETRAEIEDEEQLKLRAEQIKSEIEANKKITIEAGGLYVLGTERHENRRIDNQLRGRSGRQGDPGVSKFFLSLEDDLMRIFGSEKLQSMLSTLGLKDDESIFHPWITRTLAHAQRRVEMRHYEIRKNLLKYDDVVNEQRKIIFELRYEIMLAEESTQKLNERISEFRQLINQDLVDLYLPKNTYQEQWEISTLEAEVARIYGLKLTFDTEGADQNQILKLIDQASEDVFKRKEELYGANIFGQMRQQIFLLTIDEEWKGHLLALDRLRNGINLRAYAQKDPLIEYKREAFALFEEMMNRIEEKVVNRLARAELSVDEKEHGLNLLEEQSKQKTFETRIDPAVIEQSAPMPAPEKIKEPIKNKIKPEQRAANDPRSWGRVARNEPCPCGSTKKYKHCHG